MHLMENALQDDAKILRHFERSRNLRNFHIHLTSLEGPGINSSVKVNYRKLLFLSMLGNLYQCTSEVYPYQY